MELEVLYEDDGVVAVNKPSGLVVHEDGKTVEDSVTQWVLKQYPSLADIGEPATLSTGATVARPGIVHRLDRDTSGVLLVAKTQESFLHLKSQFQEHTIEKKYRAFVHGKMSTESGIIDRPIGRSKNDFRRWTAERGTRGEMREAVTYWKSLKMTSDASYLEVAPKTGRTHQIRVHMKAISHPIVGDMLYAPQKGTMLGFNRLALHAYSISFLPLGAAEKVTVTAPLPTDFLTAEQQIGM